MQKLLIKGKKELSGLIKISGSKNATLPILAASILAKNITLNKLDRKFLNDSMKEPMLSREEERKLAEAWVFENDKKAMHKIIKAYSKLVIAFSMKFKNYGLPVNDLVQEGHIGLLLALDRFEQSRDLRFSTYARWWVRANIQEFVLKNWSIVKTGSSSAQKSLFFNMRRVQAQLEREAQQTGENLDKHQLNQLIATEVGVPLNDVEMMDGRLSGSDFSLNATQASDEEGREWIETLEDENARADLTVEEEHDQKRLANWIGVAMDALNEREQFIVRERKLIESPRTLESLGAELGLSKERVRQLEAAAFGKMRKYLEKNAGEVRNFL